MVKVLATLDEFKAALEEAGEKLVVVDFFATWCPPCVTIGPEFALLPDSHGDDGKYQDVRSPKSPRF